jgi:hypothetical protein
VAKKVSDEVQAVTEEKRYSKEEIVKSVKYSNRSDLLKVLLEDGGTFTETDINNRIANFLKGKVK